ncbi:MAG: hypothetical protein GY854_25115 [Deltaproteobacteria bacterium]|nr:hypothetical protein [Deltaproteobacteria bacterium]
MSTANTNAGRVRRLLDMVVEEVSLVDRAANKRRFLIVKRSDEMDINEPTKEEVSKDTEGKTSPTQTEPAATEAGTGEADVSVDDTEQGADETKGEDGTLEVAAQALESLTNAVERLIGAGEGEAEVSVTDLAARLKEISDQLVPTAGDSDEQDESTDASPPDDNSAQDRDTPDTQNDLAALLTALNDVLKPLGTLLAGRAITQKAAAPPPSESGDNERIGTIANAISTLTKLYAEQQQRLAHIEKSFGLPNSKPAGESGKGAKGSESWPLDLNTPVDRDSVDKAVSFHD